MRFAVVVLLAAVVVAQEQPPRPTFRTEANYVRVDVYPTKDGAPVSDLTKDDFEVLEDGAAQRIEQFEHVAIRGNIPQEMRREPNTVAESREAIQNPRARVFVVFLDVGHVDVAGSHRIRQPLIDMLNRLIGQDDLVAVMTPEMSPLDLAFARKTTTVEGMLTRYWTWGDRDKLNAVDPVEEAYRSCYAGDQQAIAEEMIARRREKQTLEALQDLVVYLRTAREERKAVIAISDGWRLYTLNRDLAGAGGAGGASPTPIGIDPGGRLTVGDSKIAGTIPQNQCQNDRLALAQVDHPRLFERILDEANRANTSFYPIDPRGIAAFDSLIERAAVNDRAILQRRNETLRTLAAGTDGIAIIQNDVDRGLRRIVDDLSSYYLLGYYSSGKLDGKFHSIAVRVTRPGVQVRARRGYLASTSASAAAAAAPAAAPAKAAAEAAAVSAVIAPLAGYAREIPLRVQAAAGWKGGGGAPAAAVWVAGELSAAREFEDLSKAGGVATVELAPADGASLASARATLAPGTRTFRVALTPAEPLMPGEYVVRTSVRPADTAVPARDTLRVSIPPSPRSTGAMWSRRGQATANRDAPTADLRFRRGEQAKVEIPWAAAETPTARLLDRAGRPLAVPVTTAMRSDPDGARWATAQVNVAPLAPGEYVVEVSQGSERMLAAFRVVP